MWILLVVLLALVVGGGVYVLSLRSLDEGGTSPAPRASSPARRERPGRLAAPSAPVAAAMPTPPAAMGTVYVPLALDERPSISTRLSRLLGLAALVCVAGLILAISIWQAAVVIGDLLRHYLSPS